MIIIYFISFLMLLFGLLTIVNYSIKDFSKSINNIFKKKESLKEFVEKVKNTKKKKSLKARFENIKYEMEITGNEYKFSVVLIVSIFLVALGTVLAISMNNIFLIPTFAIGFSLIPFAYCKGIISNYEKNLNSELETALSIITTSYLRNEDIVSSVRENIMYLKPPLSEIFNNFLYENIMISSNIKENIRRLKDKIDNVVFHEWCENLILCQDDRTLKDTLLPIVTKLTDTRIVNSEIKGVLASARSEYFAMTSMVLLNIPLLYFINFDWYNALMNTIFGKIVLGISGITIVVTFLFMLKYTKPIEYGR